MNISDKTILITGGGTGIGLALARALFARGNSVLICGRREEPLRAAAEEMPGLEYFLCDVAVDADRRRLFEWVTERPSPINVLINNAGIQRPINLLEGTRDLAHAESEIITNLLAPIHLTGLFISHLMNIAGEGGESAIVNITSGLAFIPLAGVPVYCATKAALHSYTESLRWQLRETGVGVFEVAPPLVESELHMGREVIGMALSSEEAARVTLAGVEEDKYFIRIGRADWFWSLSHQNPEGAVAAFNGSL
ncbi:MAG: SDR family NAD(P)-dependent oxidoreductase [Bacteroidota bacterium]